MKKLFVLYKIPGIVIGTLFFYGIFLLGYFFLRLAGRPVAHWRNKILTFWGLSTARILSIKIDVRGKPPEPPFFMVTNHLSYIDIIVLLATLKTTFVAKAEVSDWPVLGRIARSIGIIFIDRTRKRDVSRVNEEITQCLNKWYGVTLFAEGTTSAGQNVLPFKASLLESPANADIGVSYCAIRYNTGLGQPPAYKSVNWWRDVSMFEHLLNLTKLSFIQATITFGDQKIHLSDRKILADKLHYHVNQLFDPMCHSKDDNTQLLRYQE